MGIDLDRDSDLPLHSQITAALRRQIERGELTTGARLPSSRDLAEEVGVNRTTVVQSYGELKAAGLIESGVGRGSFVAVQGTAPQPPAGAVDRRLAWGKLLAGGAGSAPLPAQPTVGDGPVTTLLPLARAVANPELFPVDAVRQHHREAMDELGGAVLGYAPPAGHEPLRMSLRRRFEARGIDMSGRDILIVGGSQQGLDLVSRLLPQRGSILTSAPTFSGALKLFSRYHDCVAAPLDERGLDPAGVEGVIRTLRAHRPKLLYTLPFCHNPTGIVQDPDRGRLILDVARRYDLPILEDDWLGDLRTEDDAPPLTAHDDCGHVLYLGTASKVLVPGLRLGWIVAPDEAFARLLSLKSDTDLATNLPAQATLHRMLESGAYDTHAGEMRRALDRRRRITLAAIDEHFPPEVRPLADGRGMVMWLRLPAGVDQTQLVRSARSEGLDIAAGYSFVPRGADPGGFRISYAEAAGEELETAIAILGRVLHQFLRSAPLAAAPPLV